MEYWQRVRAACDKHGALLILDEIPTGLGRTGTLFVHEHFGIVPDMVILGKGLGGGIFPLAALIAREYLNTAAPHKALGHYTHEKNPVACAAGIATLQCLTEDGLLENARARGEQALALLQAMQGQYPCISEVRGIGLLLGVVLMDPKSGKRNGQLAERILYAALERGLSFKITMGNILTLMPPLTITAKELAVALDILRDCFKECTAE
jgi:4-aminobutyrate aminotransferase